MANVTTPKVILISGPNGAGKSTAAPGLLKGALAVSEFVNADVIATGLSAFDSESVALAAGRIMLERLDQLAAAGKSFAFETTLASRTFAPRIGHLKKLGYDFHLFYLWVPSPELSILRIQSRVRQGGHFIPDDVVRTRYRRGLQNFFTLYRPLATSWQVYNSQDQTGPVLIAHGGTDGETIVDSLLWTAIREEAGR
jgi:predicted ABC-type ATPase